MLTFDEAAHRYYWNGQPVPNVTTIIKSLSDYSMVNPEVLERARQQGVAIHKMVELDIADDLDVDTLPEWMRGYHKAWKLFQAEAAFDVWVSEHRLYHPKMGYAGTPDLIGIFTRGDFAGEQSIIDVKRSFMAGPAIGVQIAAYVSAWNANLIRADKRKVSGRYGLQLRPNGTYRLEPFTDPLDIAVFTACLTTYRWRERNGKPE